MAAPLLLGVLASFTAPILFLVFGMVILAASGWSLGIRKAGIRLLLRIFEYGRKITIEKQRLALLDDATTSADTPLSDEVMSLDSGVSEEPPPSPTEEMVPLPPALRVRRVTQCLNSAEIEDIICDPSPRNSDDSDGLTVMRSTSADADLGTAQDTFKKLTNDVVSFASGAVEAIIHDEVTQRFGAAELPAWNLLTRHMSMSRLVTETGSWRLTAMWTVGVFIRYCVLFPFRAILFAIGITWLVASHITLGFFPDSKWRRTLVEIFSVATFRILGRVIGADVTYHDVQNRPRNDGICVANHTSPIDVLVLSMDRAYSMIGQRHSGFFGLIQGVLSSPSNHIWFERSETFDRGLVTSRLNAHVQNPNTFPVLIFPEGVCINNTCIMQFKKGTFEVPNVTIYPAAIKYNQIFADPFWNSSRQSLLEHIFSMMTSWAIVCDIYYLPPTTLRVETGETAIEFASRVKAAIAEIGGLVDLDWDGALKRSRPKPSLIEDEKQIYSEMLKMRHESDGDAGPTRRQKSDTAATDASGSAGTLGDNSPKRRLMGWVMTAKTRLKGVYLSRYGEQPAADQPHGFDDPLLD